MKFSKIMGLALLVILGCFVALNSQPSEINLVIIQAKMPLAIALLLSGAGGFASAVLLRRFRKDRA